MGAKVTRTAGGISDPQDGSKKARVGNFGDGANLGDGLVAHAIAWLTEPISGIRRMWRCNSKGEAYCVDAGPSQTLVQKYSTSADMSTALQIVVDAPPPGHVHVFVDLIIGVGTACVMTIQDEDDVALLAMPMAANDKFFGTTRGYIQTVGVAKKTEVKTSVASTGYVWAKYFSQAV